MASPFRPLPPHHPPPWAFFGLALPINHPPSSPHQHTLFFESNFLFLSVFLFLQARQGTHAGGPTRARCPGAMIWKFGKGAERGGRGNGGMQRGRRNERDRWPSAAKNGGGGGEKRSAGGGQRRGGGGHAVGPVRVGRQDLSPDPETCRSESRSHNQISVQIAVQIITRTGCQSGARAPAPPR